MLQTKIQPQSLRILPNMGMVAIFFNGAGKFEQIVNIPSTESLICNLVKIGQAYSKAKTVKDHTILYTCMYIAQKQGQILLACANF